jgi:hypothetical protein
MKITFRSAAVTDWNPKRKSVHDQMNVPTAALQFLA